MPIHVSATALNEFISCEYKLYFKLFEQIEFVPTKEMLMGTITHKILEKAWDDEHKALAMVDTFMLEHKDKLGPLEENSIRHFLHIYFERFKVMLRPDDKIEKRFKVKLYDDVFLVGVFDRVTMGTVIDWKTNANPPKRIDNNVQFIIYNMAYNLVYGKPAEGLYLAALKDGSLVRYKESKEHSTALIEDIIPRYVKTIKDKSFAKMGLFSGACYRCPYKVPCLGEKDVVVYPAVIEE